MTHASMKIGKLVKHHIKKIFRYCESTDGELERLQNNEYSKNTFGIYFPFCTEKNLIPKDKLKKYWIDDHLVMGKTVRVSSQWFSKQKGNFIKYLVDNKISTLKEIEQLTDIASIPEEKYQASTKKNNRYKGSAIGNAQNLLIRNILNNLGEESFSKEEWKKTKIYFDNQCAYCGSEDELVIEHVISINRQSLGEHRLGNLIPSCKSCNAKKSDKDYQEFLNGQQSRIEKIQKYMESRNYVPLGDNEQVRKILNMAYQELGIMSQRYILILNELFPNN